MQGHLPFLKMSKTGKYVMLYLNKLYHADGVVGPFTVPAH